MASPSQEDTADCPELDDDFFNCIGESYDVVDAWSAKDKEESTKNNSTSKRIKHEPEVKRRSKSRTDSTSQDSRSRINNNSKERSRSPVRRRRRWSRSKSPLARREATPQWRKSGPPPGARASFLEEMIQKFPDMAKQQSQYQRGPPVQNLTSPNFEQNNMMYPGVPPPMMPMGTPGFMPSGFVQPPIMNPAAPFPGPPIGIDPYGQPYPINSFNNQIISPVEPPLMVPGTSGIPLNIPPPVPAPERPTNASRQVSEETVFHQALKKAFDDKKISLSEFLRQCSQTKKKDQISADVVKKKSKVHERCKKAAKMLEDLAKSSATAPFVFKISGTTVPSIRSDPSVSRKSPLVASDSSSLFMMQSRLSQCRDAIQGNPLRNIEEKIFGFARNLGVDLVNVSNQAQRKIEIMREKEKDMAAAKHFNASIKKLQKHVQTDAAFCEECKKREMRRKSKHVQTDEPEEPKEDPNIFNAKIDVQNLNRDQEKAMQDLCRAFNISDVRFPNVKRRTWDSDDEVEPRESDDRMTFANPENPNVGRGLNFISFSSPAREDSDRETRRSPSRSPRRSSYQSPTHSLSRSSNRNQFRNSRSNSPLDYRARSPKRLRITDRLGAKIPSPQTSHWNRARADSMEYLRNDQSPGLTAYRDPTPPRHSSQYDQYSRSPPGRYRERSRSRSRSGFRRSPPTRYRQPSISPEINRAERRGRY